MPLTRTFRLKEIVYIGRHPIHNIAMCVAIRPTNPNIVLIEDYPINLKCNMINYTKNTNRLNTELELLLNHVIKNNVIITTLRVTLQETTLGIDKVKKDFIKTEMKVVRIQTQQEQKTLKMYQCMKLLNLQKMHPTEFNPTIVWKEITITPPIDR